MVCNTPYCFFNAFVQLSVTISGGSSLWSSAGSVTPACYPTTAWWCCSRTRVTLNGLR